MDGRILLAMKITRSVEIALLMVSGLGVCLGLSGCIMMGASSRGGFFILPGGIGLVVMILLFVWLLRRR